MVVEGRKNQPTVYIREEKEETSEDGESSIHSNMLLMKDIAQTFQGKKSSLVPIPHRRLLAKGKIRESLILQNIFVSKNEMLN